MRAFSTQDHFCILIMSTIDQPSMAMGLACLVQLWK